MSLTPEQRAADAGLREAIQRAVEAYSGVDFPLTVTDFMVMVAAQGYAPDGRPVTSYRYLLDEVEPPPHRIFGLMKMVAAQYDEDVSMSEYAEEEE